MKLFLAPMEGVVDFQMREFLSGIGGFDMCITEFIRVVDQLLPQRVFHRFCPELKNNGYTNSGTPVRIQLLGQSPVTMGENAARAAELGSHGIDINFGCPAKTVNKHKGGAVLLKDPEHIYRIVASVRTHLPKDCDLSVKIRLGYEDKSLAIENAQAIEDAGAGMLTVHARTKTEGYKPPAHWPWIQRINEVVTIPVVANGEIWSVDDFWQCKQESGVTDFMLGRGALSMPDLARMIKGTQQQASPLPLQWPELLEAIILSSESILATQKRKYLSMRTKQWLGYLKRQYPQAEQLFEYIKRDKDAAVVMEKLRAAENNEIK